METSRITFDQISRQHGLAKLTQTINHHSFVNAFDIHNLYSLKKKDSPNYKICRLYKTSLCSNVVALVGLELLPPHGCLARILEGSHGPLDQIERCSPRGSSGGWLQTCMYLMVTASHPFSCTGNCARVPITLEHLQVKTWNPERKTRGRTSQCFALPDS
jgi:hypothetical protein